MFDVFHPVPHILERLFVCGVVHKHDSHGSSIICFGDGSETLLPCCVPDLKLAALLINHDFLNLEVDTAKLKSPKKKNKLVTPPGHRQVKPPVQQSGPMGPSPELLDQHKRYV